jgi:two-component system chemotaxis sensor kinase CheA
MGDTNQGSRTRAASIEQSVDGVSRAAFRARQDDAKSLETLGGGLAALEQSCRVWFDAVLETVSAARTQVADLTVEVGETPALAEPRERALEAVVATIGELSELLVRGVAPGVPAAASATGDGRIEDETFIDYGALFAPDEGGIGADEASTVDMRSLPTFENEAQDHLDQADLHVIALEASPQDEEALNALFRCMHTLKGSSAIIGLTPVKELAHEAEQVLELARAKQLRVAGAVCDVLFEALDDLRRLVTSCAEDANAGRKLSATPSPAVLGALRSLVRTGSALAAPRIGDVLVDFGLAKVADVEHAAAQQAKAATALRPSLAPKPVDDHRAARHADVVRVDAERLDRFVDAIGELVIAESMVAHSPDLRASPLFAKLARPIGQLDKIARTLQEMATSLRMVAVKDTFQRMHRTVRDVSRACGKDVSFVIGGEGTELDKAVVDQLGDPLMHLVRNAVDHGIEASDVRVAAGKPAQGRIELRAVHAGDEVHIEVEDDGRGLDKDAILAKGAALGLVREGATLTDSQIFALVFEPGFSTAKAVTDISGRGVGTDVVKRTVESLRGRVEVRSEKGRGSVFRLRLPLTMAVIDGMLVAVGTHRYILPTLSVVRTVQRSRDEITELLGGARTIELNEKWIPVRSLAELLRAPERSNARGDDRQLIVVVEQGGRRLGLVVDHLLGQQQIVIKSLGSALDAAAIAGGAILPDGTVGLVLELADLLELATTEARAAA